MKRRDFLRSVLMASLGAGVGAGLMPKRAYAQVPTNDRPVLLNITLRGGPDFRHMIAPAYDADESSYGYAYWSHRWRTHEVSDAPSSWQQKFTDDFLSVDGMGFGILGQAGWLKQQFDAGNVAIVNNVLASTTRDHSHSLLVYESGDLGTSPNELSRDGWGGRLAHAVGGNVVSMTSQVRLFCNGPNASDPRDHDNSRVITAQNTRDIALYHAPELEEEPGSRGSRQVMSRALSSYYAALDLPETSPYYRVQQHERAFRAFGDLVEGRLSTIELPAAIEALYEGDNPTLTSTAFGQQIRNVYDSFACSDIFDFRVGSLVYDGFDTHRDQRSVVEPKFSDMFGTGMGLDTLYSALSSTMPDALENLVIVIGGEFGRQLTGNGDQGTDHGRGNTVLVIGNRVNGGVYGDLFPASEIPRFAEPSADIDGKTTVDSLYSVLSDWVESWASPIVFPNLADSATVEDGVDLSLLVS